MDSCRINKPSIYFGALLLISFILPAAADDIDDITATTQKWVTAFNHKSTEEITALYADDAVFFGTSSPVIRDTPSLVTEYFSGFSNLGDINMAVGDHRIQLFGEVAINTGYYTMTSNDNGQVTDSNARFTFVYAKRDGQWIIVEHHSSALP